MNRWQPVHICSLLNSASIHVTQACLVVAGTGLFWADYCMHRRMPPPHCCLSTEKHNEGLAKRQQVAKLPLPDTLRAEQPRGSGGI
jgi:hypothetical protein